MVAIESASNRAEKGESVKVDSTSIKPNDDEHKESISATTLASPGLVSATGIPAIPDAQKSKSIGNYLLGKQLGEGTFGKVRLATHVLTGEKVAVKILEKDRIKDVADVERVQREIHILKLLRHSNIIQLYEIIETPKLLLLIMEYASGGELFDYIVANRRVNEKEAMRFFLQIISGIEYTHKLNIVHRDMKPENLLLNYDKSIKIVDFGLSNTYKKNELLKTACGSPCYAAPEMIAGKRYDGLGVDIWSCGVVLFTMLCGYLPFEDSNTSILYKKILGGEFKISSNVSPDAQDLLLKILTTDPQKRLSISEIRSHAWCSSTTLNKLPEGIIVGLNSIPIDRAILKSIEQFGLSPEFALKSLEANKHNNATTCYYLLLRKLVSSGGKSIADISSSEFDSTLLLPIKRPTKKADKKLQELVKFDEENQDSSNLRACSVIQHSSKELVKSCLKNGSGSHLYNSSKNTFMEFGQLSSQRSSFESNSGSNSRKNSVLQSMKINQSFLNSMMASTQTTASIQQDLTNIPSKQSSDDRQPNQQHAQQQQQQSSQQQQQNNRTFKGQQLQSKFLFSHSLNSSPVRQHGQSHISSQQSQYVVAVQQNPAQFAYQPQTYANGQNQQQQQMNNTNGGYHTRFDSSLSTYENNLSHNSMNTNGNLYTHSSFQGETQSYSQSPKQSLLDRRQGVVKNQGKYFSLHEGEEIGRDGPKQRQSIQQQQQPNQQQQANLNGSFNQRMKFANLKKNPINMNGNLLVLQQPNIVASSQNNTSLTNPSRAKSHIRDAKTPTRTPNQVSTKKNRVLRVSIGERGELIHQSERERGKSTEPLNHNESYASRIEGQTSNNNQILLNNNVLTFETVLNRHQGSSATPSRSSLDQKNYLQNLTNINPEKQMAGTPLLNFIKTATTITTNNNNNNNNNKRGTPFVQTSAAHNKIEKQSNNNSKQPNKLTANNTQNEKQQTHGVNINSNNIFNLGIHGLQSNKAAQISTTKNQQNAGIYFPSKYS